MTNAPPPPSGRLTVVFVGGLGRSGSTLVDRMLGQLPGFVPVGELREIWQRGFIANHLCGCGVPFRECGFWRAATLEAFGGLEPAAAREILALKEPWDQRRRSLSFVFPALRPTVHRTAIRAYAERLGCLLRAVAKISGGRVIVDSSKTPAHLVALAEIADVDVHVVHLVRDPRAVAYSWRRTLRRRDVYCSEQYFPRVHPAKTALLWAGINVLLWYQQRTVKSYRRIRYEDLVRSPHETMARIAQALGKPPPATPGIGADEVQLDVHHTIAGNPVKFRSGSIPVRLDAEWESRMTRPARFLVTALTWPLLRAYGYPR